MRVVAVGFGGKVRGMLGRLEPRAAEFYRSIFIDLDEVARQVPRLPGEVHRMLEIGSGDGSLATRLTAAYPSAEYLGIDIDPAAGRLFRGDPGRARFRTVTSAELRAERPDPFDLVLIVDVLHHVPEAQRTGMLRDAAALTAPGGYIVIKEWERRRGIWYRIGLVADRFVSGDRGVNFMTGNGLERLLSESLPEFALAARTRIRPRAENAMYALQRPRPRGHRDRGSPRLASPCGC